MSVGLFFLLLKYYQFPSASNQYLCMLACRVPSFWELSVVPWGKNLQLSPKQAVITFPLLSSSFSNTELKLSKKHKLYFHTAVLKHLVQFVCSIKKEPIRRIFKKCCSKINKSNQEMIYLPGTVSSLVKNYWSGLRYVWKTNSISIASCVYLFPWKWQIQKHKI